MVGAEWGPAEQLPATINTEVEQSDESLTRKEPETSEILYPKIYLNQSPMIEQVLETSGLITRERNSYRFLFFAPSC